MDRYTKAILTVIAIALSLIAIENIGGARADLGLQKVAICTADGTKCMDLRYNSFSKTWGIIVN